MTTDGAKMLIDTVQISDNTGVTDTIPIRNQPDNRKTPITDCN